MNKPINVIRILSVIACLIGIILSIFATYSLNSRINASAYYGPIGPVSIIEIGLAATPFILLLIAAVVPDILTACTALIFFIILIIATFYDLSITNLQHGTDKMLGSYLIKIGISIIGLLASGLAVLLSMALNKYGESQ